MREDGKIDYVEWPAADLPAAKAFYRAAFGWTFQDWGDAYCDCNEGLNAGFTSEPHAPKPLVILYAHDLEAMQAKVEAAGGVITRQIMSFPGGRRFHFTDPVGNELGVWSEG